MTSYECKRTNAYHILLKAERNERTTLCRACDSTVRQSTPLTCQQRQCDTSDGTCKTLRYTVQGTVH